jgi:excisionase family DNA binding protein
MEKIITIAQAAEYLGVSRQTIKNWIDNGIIKTHGVTGKQYWIDANTLTALKDTAEDVEKQKEKLAHLKAELHKSIQEEQTLVNEIKANIGLIRRTKNLTAAKDFYLSIPEMMHDLGVISARERDIVKSVIVESGLSKAAEAAQISLERARQIFVKAIRKSKDLTDIKARLVEAEELKSENKILTKEIELLKKEIELNKKTEEMSSEQRSLAFLEIDNLCRLLNTRIADYDLSVRALNCLGLTGIETIGDLVSCSKTDLLKRRNFGKKSLAEIESLVDVLNLSFNMDVDSIYRKHTLLSQKEQQ